MEIKVFKDATELSHALAEWMVMYVDSVLKKQERFTIALSGGSTPQKLHTVLASSPYKKKIKWNKIHIFWGDERAVPFDDERNNARMAYETLLNHVPVATGHVHMMRTDIDPAISAKEYEKVLQKYFSHTSHSFDLVLLGMGDDAHTLSLFPGSPISKEKGGWVKAFYLHAQNMYRITLTPEIVNRSASVVFLATGKNKAIPLRNVLTQPYNPDLYPSQLIKPAEGLLYWFVDEQAASQLNDVI